MTPTKKYLFLLSTLERIYVKRFYKIATLVYSSFIDDLRTNGLDHARGNLLLRVFNPDIVYALQEIYKRGGVQGARIQYNELKKWIKEHKKAGGFGRNERWLQEVISFLKQFGLEMAVKIDETIKEDILNLLQKAVDEGWSIADLADRMENSKLPLARAKVIARTEVMRAFNVGHSIGAKELPFEVNKKWSAAADFRTRNSHKLVNGHIVDEYGIFKVPIYKKRVLIGYDEMQYPGDKKASAANVCNCRCRVLYIPKLDEKGNPIRRSNSAVVIPISANLPARLPASTRIAAELKSWIADHITVDVDREEE